MVISAMIDRVQDALDNLGAECPIEEVVALCPDLTWNQVFLAIDYLSSTGQVRVLLDPGRTYLVQSLHAAVSGSGQISASHR